MSENPEKYGIINEEDSDETDEETVVRLDRTEILAFLAAAFGLVDTDDEDESSL